VTYNNKYH